MLKPYEQFERETISGAVQFRTVKALGSGQRETIDHASLAAAIEFCLAAPRNNRRPRLYVSDARGNGVLLREKDFDQYLKQWKEK